MIKILYEDNHLLFVEKPVNMPVQEDQSRDQDLLTYLKLMIKERDHKPGDVYLGLVHRLDRPVGGVLVFAKTSKAAARLANQLRLRQIDRQYLAVCRHKVKSDHGQLVDYLVKDRRHNHSYVTDQDHPQAKIAKLQYWKCAYDPAEDLSLVKVELETGRSHQIRLQFAHMNHPLYGDQRYGHEVNQPGQQIALWADRLSLIHPTKKDRITVDCPPPDVFPWSIFPWQASDHTIK